jgi:NAD(P)H-dependent FMN reductase
MLENRYKDYPAGSAPQAMEDIAGKIREADAFMFVVGEYNWGPQPGLKNLTGHFQAEWFWLPAAIMSYSAGRMAGVRAASAWHPILSEMGMVVISSTVAVGPVADTLDADGKPVGEAGQLTQTAFHRVVDDLAWWTSAARNERLRQALPY